MIKQILLVLILIGCLCLMVSPSLAQEQTGKDELNYSASMCTPMNAGQFQGSGREGFDWDLRGFWVNRDDDQDQQLICPVPFDPRALQDDGTPARIEVRLTVYDGSRLHELEAWLLGVVDSDNLLNSSAESIAADKTYNRDQGIYTLYMCNADPLPTNLRYLWMLINVPRVVLANSSAVIGYRVNRVQDCENV